MCKPDNDLGKATRLGYRNAPKNGDENRIFGIPTLRTDLNKSNLKSIADPTVFFFLSILSKHFLFS